ncbi:MAG: DegV family protein, partial [Lachnospiraceae bacterium]|nr:DegV family protein [Lachnospiraceae bacterium]
MKKTAIIADTTCDLSVELKERYQIKTFPLHIHLGDKEYSDGVDISPDDIYRWSDENKATPKTSAISPAEANDVLEAALKDAESVICFCISDQMSSTGNVLRLAVQELEAEDKVFVVDSKSLSTGIGLQIIEAAILAEQGMDAKEIVEKISNITPRVRASFVVDTLTYLHRGGRCSGLAALAGGALKLHPLISVIDGKMLPGKKYRGKMNRVLIEYV